MTKNIGEGKEKVTADYNEDLKEETGKEKAEKSASKDEQDSNTKLLQLPRSWIVLMTIRLLINIFGQRSYIHPDEFFQGLEVIAGDLFNCNHTIFRAWEFQIQNITNELAGTSHIQEPIRNIAIPYIFYGLPLMLLKFINSLVAIRDYSVFTNKLDSSFSVTPIQANTLIYYPRIFMTICSLLIDFSILKSSELFGLDGSSVIITFATSYLAMVYLTRTFSNTIETMLFSILIYLVIKSIKSQHILNDKFLIATESGKNSISTLIASSSDLVNSTFQSHNESSAKKVPSPQKTAATLKRLKLFDIFKYNYLGSWIGLVICIGFFNRPTFIFFAVVPVAYWILYGLESSHNFQQFFSFTWRRCLALTKLAVPCLILLVIIDTAYYLNLTGLNDLVNLILKRDKKLIITPYNFFEYNFNPENLKTHGTHPFYLHAVVNCVILFGVNHFILYLIFFNFFGQVFQSIRNQAETDLSKFKCFTSSVHKFYQLIINNRFCFLLFCYLVPLCLFSLVSHQEPRFLLPLIIPICLLTGHCVFGQNSFWVLRFVWISFNFLALVFYGYIHQGGVIGSLNFVQKMFTHVGNLEMDQHVIYYNTYMPPRFMVMAPFSANIINNKRFVYEKNKKRFEEQLEDGNFNAKFRSEKPVYAPERQIYDFMSSGSLEDIHELILSIKTNSTNKNDRIRKNLAIFLIAPAALETQLNLEYDESDICKPMEKNKGRRNISFQRQNQFKFHFSGEHLTEQLAIFKCNYSGEIDQTMRKCLENRCKRSSYMQRAINAFTLNFYQVIL